MASITVSPVGSTLKVEQTQLQRRPRVPHHRFFAPTTINRRTARA
jgi:hypothetical protein